MYIRRKVFSTLIDEAGEERLFSTTDFVYDDRYFSEDDEEEEDGWWDSLNKKQKAAVIAGGTALGTAATIAGAKFGGKAIAKVGNKIRTNKALDQDTVGNYDKAIKLAKRGAAKMEKVGKALQVPADKIVSGSKEAGGYIKGVFTKKKK